MDAKRLEELVKLAECESKYFTYRGPCSEQDLLDLARCAAAWAKVERMLMSRRSIGLRRSGTRRILDSPLVWGDTFIEAVEAAQEKP